MEKCTKNKEEKQIPSYLLTISLIILHTTNINVTINYDNFNFSSLLL